MKIFLTILALLSMVITYAITMYVVITQIIYPILIYLNNFPLWYLYNG